MTPKYELRLPEFYPQKEPYTMAKGNPPTRFTQTITYISSAGFFTRRQIYGMAQRYDVFISIDNRHRQIFVGGDSLDDINAAVLEIRYLLQEAGCL